MSGKRAREFEVFYSEFYDAGMAFVNRRLSGFHEVGQELVHDAFLNLWKKMKGKNKLANPRGFFFICLRNSIIDNYRKKERKYKFVSLNADDVEEKTLYAARDLTFETSSLAEYNQMMKWVGENLSVYERKVLLLRVVDGLPPVEISKRLESTPNRISMVLHRIMLKYQKRVIHRQDLRSRVIGVE